MLFSPFAPLYRFVPAKQPNFSLDSAMPHLPYSNHVNQQLLQLYELLLLVRLLFWAVCPGTRFVLNEVVTNNRPKAEGGLKQLPRLFLSAHQKGRESNLSGPFSWLYGKIGR
jgi:hypothetical protein